MSLYSRIREYRLSGHSIGETQKRFGVSKNSVRYACRGMQIGSMKPTPSISERERLVIDAVKKSNPRLEYVGGFVNSKTPFFVRCEDCGHVFAMVKQSFTERSVQCPECKKAVSARRQYMNKKNAVVKDIEDGQSPKDVAARYGIGVSTAYKWAKTCGVVKTTLKERVFDCLKNGMQDEDVAKNFGTSVAYVARVRRCYGMKKPPCRRQEAFYKQVADYRLAKHTIKETMDHFGVKKDLIMRATRGMFIGYANSDPHTKSIEAVKEDILKRNSRLEYVDGYVNTASMVRVKCLDCGQFSFISMSTVRNPGNHARCKVCGNCEGIKNTLRIDTYMNYWVKSMRQKPVKPVAIKPKTMQKPKTEHECLICGKLTTRPKYCSKACANKEAWRRKGLKKRKFAKEKCVDAGITAMSLYKRDHGICWICGLPCDPNDFERRDGYFIAGNLYPSVDHVIPRFIGGEDSWANVKLAHRICNTKRYSWEKPNCAD